ncbi:tape measure protein [Scandinavium sp. M-37]|uniref:tape measure protein n=1 Tax=Scandinavium sp. M-37 TaxID=3373077 RepID=UPI0037467238
MAGTQSAGSIVYDVDMDLAGFLRGQRQVSDSLSGMNRGFDASTRSINSTERSVNNAERSFSSLTKVAVALTAALSVRQVAQYAEAWVTVNNKLANAIRPSEELADVTERVFDISQKTRSSLEATATLYARLERATRSAGTSTEDLTRLTETINKGLAVSGATAEEASSTMVQLSQALASGVLRGEEFNSISENGSRLAVALSDSLGVTVGQLRAMAAQGKLTTDVVVKGLLSQGDQIAKEFSNTAMTMGQAFAVATNNVTKFVGESSTIKSVYAGASNSIVTLSENLDALSGVITIAAAVLGSRFVGALAMATAEKVRSAVASRAMAIADNQAAQSAALVAAAELRSAEAAKIRSLEEVRLAQMMKLTAVSATAAAAAEETLSAARVSAATATGTYNAALAANKTAQDAATAAASRASVAGGLLRGALGLIGGPAGAAMLAGAAIFYFWQKAKEARDEAEKLADSVDSLTNKMKDMSQVQLTAEIAKLRDTIPELTDAVNEAQQAYDKATNKVKDYQKEIDNWGESTRRGRQAQEAMGAALDSQAIAADNLQSAQNRLSRVNSTVGIAQAELNGQLKQGIDLLQRSGKETGVVAGMMNQLGKSLNLAAAAKERFNSQSLEVERPAKVQDYLDKQSQQIELQSELNDRKREQLKAEQEIRAIGGNDADVRMARERAGAEYDALAAQKANRKEQKEGESQAKKSATAAESVSQKLEKLRQQSELSAESTKELSREQSILTAQQSLGKGATQQQIAQAGQYAAAKWDTANAIKAEAAAQKLIPEASENASYKKDVDDLNTALDAKKISQEQYNSTSERLEQTHQASLAKIRADLTVTPQQAAAGTVDPVQQLANENAQKLALIQQFEANKTITEQQGLALRNAANMEYEQARANAMWELFKNQSDGNQILAAGFESLAGNASNAFTGIITGSMSAQEAMQSLASNALNSLINGFVQMGVEWVKSAITGSAAQISATAATTSASVAGIATTTAASTASAATTTASWLPAAAAASIGSFGGAAVIGIGALVAGMALANGLAGKRKNGGPVSAGSMYQVGEGGMPEIYQASSGKQYMIPGDNGKVISNKDMQSASGQMAVNIVFNDYSSNQHSFDAQASQDGNTLTVQAFIQDMDQGGPMRQSITRNTNATPRATE